MARKPKNAGFVTNPSSLIVQLGNLASHIIESQPFQPAPATVFPGNASLADGRVIAYAQSSQFLSCLRMTCDQINDSEKHAEMYQHAYNLATNIEDICRDLLDQSALGATLSPLEIIRDASIDIKKCTPARIRKFAQSIPTLQSPNEVLTRFPLNDEGRKLMRLHATTQSKFKSAQEPLAEKIFDCYLAFLAQLETIEIYQDLNAFYAKRPELKGVKSGFTIVKDLVVVVLRQSENTDTKRAPANLGTYVPKVTDVRN